MAKLIDYLKNIFFILIFLSVAPSIVMGLKQQLHSFLEKKTKVGVVSVSGIINNSGKIVKDLKYFFESDDIKAIVLKISSPGGVPGSSQAIYNEIKNFKHQYNKPVIAYIENIGTSGAYYVSCAADTIIATSCSIVGSIGVILNHLQLKEFIEQFKIKLDFIKTGEFKASGNPFAELSEQQKEMLQEMSDDVYRQFTSDVLQQRTKLSSDTKVWAEGKVFTGTQALKLGLIDIEGSQSEIITTVKEALNLKNKDEIEFEYAQKKSGLLNILFNPEEQSGDTLGLSAILNAVFSLISEKAISIN